MTCIFCDFVSGKRVKHIGGLPFEVLHETNNTISFLSINFPKKVDGHIIIIPKNHYDNIEDVPRRVQNELMGHTSLIAKVLRKTHLGCNILLNDGFGAKQSIAHTHFHVIPRESNDGILIEQFAPKKMGKKEFINLHNSIKKLL